MCNSDDLAASRKPCPRYSSDGGGTPGAEVTRLSEGPRLGDTALGRPQIYTGADGCLYVIWGKSGFKLCLVHTK